MIPLFLDSDNTGLIVIVIIIIIGLVVWANKKEKPDLPTDFTRTKAFMDAVDTAAREKFNNWRIVHEDTIKKQSHNRSTGINAGKAMEHYVSFTPEFEFNPSDVRFIGSPIDLIAFDGHSKSGDIDIWFIEVKTGKSQVSDRQERIREAVLAKRVYWMEVYASKGQIRISKHDS